MSIFETSYENPAGEWETGQGEHGEQQFLGDLLGGVLGGELTGEATGELNETQELELATELLEINSEEELEEFLGKLVSGAVRGIGNFAKSGLGKTIIGGLKNVARAALPVVGGALGSFVAPGVGTAIGSKLGSMAGKLFELELETMNEEEAEFEVARRIVRLGAAAARSAAAAPRTAPPRAVAQAALVSAARRHAPGLVRGARYAQRPSGGYPRRRPGRYGYPVPGPAGYGGFVATGVDGGNGYEPDGDGYDGDGATSSYRSRPGAGRWVRRGRKIVLYGV